MWTLSSFDSSPGNVYSKQTVKLGHSEYLMISAVYELRAIEFDFKVSIEFSSLFNFVFHLISLG